MKDIIDFLKEHVIGKELKTDELVYELENGKLEGVYSDRIIFSYLNENAWGFNLDMFIISSEKIYQLNENKDRGKLNSDFSGASVFRFELAQRESTNEITGIFRLITASAKNQKAQAIASAIYNVVLKDNRLSWKEEQMLYRDQASSKNNGYTPVSFHSYSSFYLENNKLVFNYDGTCFDVNPITLETVKSQSVFPSFISQEK